MNAMNLDYIESFIVLSIDNDTCKQNLHALVK